MRKRVLFINLFLSLALVLGFWLACGEQVPAPTALQESQQEIVLDPADPQVKAVMDVQARHTEAFLKQPGVIGTGTGMTADGRPAIVVLVQDEALAKSAPLPEIVENVPVVRMVTGEITALRGKRPPVDPTARFDRPVPIGVSTGHPAITAGTIGCRVKDAQGNVFALSNNHVYAATNFNPADCTPNPGLWNCGLGDPVIQPGSFDGGSTPADDIGTVVDFEPIDFAANANNVIDAAIARSTTALLGNATPADGYGTPLSQTATAAVGMRVMKYGRTTGQTNGRISAINATVNVNYGAPGVARFVNQIVITGSFSAGGDSGSLIVGQRKADRGKPVALLFAGSTNTTIGNPIDAVLSRFNVTVDGQ